MPKYKNKINATMKELRETATKHGLPGYSAKYKLASNRPELEELILKNVPDPGHGTSYWRKEAKSIGNQVARGTTKEKIMGAYKEKVKSSGLEPAELRKRVKASRNAYLDTVASVELERMRVEAEEEELANFIANATRDAKEFAKRVDKMATKKTRVVLPDTYHPKITSKDIADLERITKKKVVKKVVKKPADIRGDYFSQRKRK